MPDYRCIDGRLMRHDPQPDDPELETDVGACPDCSGKGCHDKFADKGYRSRAWARGEEADGGLT